MTIDLSWATAETISSALETAKTGLDGCATSAPGAVDAGEATPLITAMISQLITSAAGLSEGLGAAAGNVGTAAGSLRNADLASQQGFGAPGRP